MLISMWHLIVLTMLHCSITVFSMSLFDGLSPVTASSAVTSVLLISATRLLKATITGSVSATISPWFFNTFFFNATLFMMF